MQIGFICSLTFASLKCQTAEVLKKDCRFYCRPHRRSVGNEGLGKLQTLSGKQFHLWESFKLSAGSNFIFGNPKLLFHRIISVCFHCWLAFLPVLQCASQTFSQAFPSYLLGWICWFSATGLCFPKVWFSTALG